MAVPFLCLVSRAVGWVCVTLDPWLGEVVCLEGSQSAYEDCRLVLEGIISVSDLSCCGRSSLWEGGNHIH